MKRLNILKIFNVFNVFKPNRTTTYLGRWGKVEGLSLEERIDLANEDHCHCNEYIKKKLENNKDKKTN